MDHTASSTLWTGQAPSQDKSSQILVRDYPHRAIAIVSSTHALILRYSQTTGEAIANGSLTSVTSNRPRASSTSASDTLNSKCIVEFSPVSKHMLADYRPLTARPIYGTLGLIALGRDVFFCVITHASRVATLRPGETVERILSVQFFCLNSSEYDDVVSVDPYDAESDASMYGQNLSRRENPLEHPCLELQKLLSNGSFYYSTDFDVTNRLQDRSVDSATFDIDNFDESFLWNSYMIQPLVQFRSRLQEHERDMLDASRILTSAIRGFCLTIAIPQSSAPLRTTNTGLPSYLTVISRLSCRRAGTRFNSRGIDDDGNVANFVETETVYWSPAGVTFSYAQIRGSVPVFWEQTAGLIPGQQKITVTRSADGTQPAFNKHFEDLENAYGAVHVVNLLSATKPGEAELSDKYRNGIKHCPMSRPADGSRDHVLLRSTEYDFHAETKGPSGYEAARDIRRHIEASADGFAYYLAEETDDPADEDEKGLTPHHKRSIVVLQQEGVFRTNCLDCLDRTNLIQTMISQMAVEAFLNHRSVYATADFWMRHSSLWADNGDALSRIYAGTGALKSSFTRHGKMSLAGAIADARKSATRLYINNFADKGRQNTIDMLLGRLLGQVPVILYDPISDYVNGELQKRSNEYSSVEKINIWVGTFNLNGRTNGVDEDLSAWLCPPELGSKQPEIVVVGFQEIVELSPQQIMNSDPTRKQLWERAVKRTLDRHAKQVGGEKYVLLRSGQLVGAALCIFVRASVLHNIKNVEGSVKKTGMSGMAGNKGAVAIRFEYANTPLCFVTAHLAAGFANYEERNKDYATIYHGLRFQRNRGIDDHDAVIWCGDFNYRIGLGLERAHELVRKKDLERLYENDQLNLQMVAGLAFRYYSEARITFMPTYKYDIGTDSYDTSDKARIPAWTDRILRKGTNLRQLAYNSAPLKFSDHRPVYATFECTVNIVNEAVRDKISHDIYERRKAEVGEGTANIDTEETDDEDLIGYDSIEPGLPPASSDRQKWWLDNGKLARSTIGPPKALNASTETILNPKRPHNPFAHTEEPDWVSIPSRSRLSSFSSMSTSPYEHVNHSTILSTSASSSAQRKLPPPYDPSALPAKVGRMNLDREAPTSHPTPYRDDLAPPPPPPRRQNGTPIQQINRAHTMPQNFDPSSRKQVPPPPSTNPPTSLPQRNGSVASGLSSTKTKNPPPAVARKPAHLTATPPVSKTSSFHTTTLSNSELLNDPVPARPQLPTRASSSYVTVPRNAADVPFTSTPRMKTTSPRSSALSRELAAAAGGPSPRLPQRHGASTPTADSAGRLSPAVSGRVGLPGMSASNGGVGQLKKPPPPARKPISGDNDVASPAPTHDLLGDDDGKGVVEMRGWQALKPS